MANTKKEAKKPTVKTTPSTKLPTLDELLKAGSHFGHKKSAWHPAMDSYIYVEREGVHIIDLIKTLSQLKKATLAIEKAAENGQVLIVGTKGQAASVVQNMAEENGAFYVNKRWPGGLFTNFKAIKKSVDKLIEMEEKIAAGAEGMVKKEELLMRKNIERLNKLYQGIKFMDKLPSLVIVIDSKVEKNAIKEASLAGVPIVALVDTNCDPRMITHPVPANDDSIKSISLFVNLFGKAIGMGAKSAGLITLRKEYEEGLKKSRAAFEAEVERKAAIENQERERMKALRGGGDGVVRVVSSTPKVKEEVKKVEKDTASFDDAGLPTRTVNALSAAGFSSIDDLKGKSKGELTKIKGIGAKAADDLLDLLK